MGYHPIFVALDARRCVVIGGGAVAARRVAALLAGGATVTVVSPRVAPALAALARDGRIRHVARRYRHGDLRGQSLAFVATGDRAVSAAVAAEGRALGVLVNAADDPARCDFILPSVLRRGPLTVAVGTGGTSPALARAVREQIERDLPRHYASLAAVVGAVRRDLRARGVSPGAAAWRSALRDLRALLPRGRRGDTRRRLLARLGAA